MIKIVIMVIPRTGRPKAGNVLVMLMMVTMTIIMIILTMMMIM